MFLWFIWMCSFMQPIHDDSSFLVTFPALWVSVATNRHFFKRRAHLQYRFFGMSRMTLTFTQPYCRWSFRVLIWELLTGVTRMQVWSIVTVAITNDFKSHFLNCTEYNTIAYELKIAKRWKGDRSPIRQLHEAMVSLQNCFIT